MPLVQSTGYLSRRNTFAVAHDARCRTAYAHLPPQLQLETADLQACDVLKTKLNEVGTVNFWAKFVPDSQYPVSKKLAVSVFAMFGLTYSCESAFSTMNAIKSKHRSVITDQHLQNAMRIALTYYSRNYTSVVKSRKHFHTSH